MGTSRQGKFLGSKSNTRNGIRIKTLEKNPIDKRKTFSQNIKLTAKVFEEGGLSTMKPMSKVKGAKSYYNMYEKSGNGLVTSSGTWGNLNQSSKNKTSTGGFHVYSNKI